MPVKISDMICKDHTGKMEGMWSLSTNCRTNPCCLKNKEIKGSICSHCYAQIMAKQYTDLAKKLQENADILTTRLLTPSEIPELTTPSGVFRFESFGDIHNLVHLANYVAIAKHNPQTRFTLWTKNYTVAAAFFSKYECPENMTLIISSMMVNKKTPIFDLFKRRYHFTKGQLKVFTVYDYKYIKDNYDKGIVHINCGSRYCLGCRLCYDKNDIEEISEVLKNDQARVVSFMLRKDPTYDKVNSEMADELEAAISLK
jgi:hypothetical protein